MKDSLYVVDTNLIFSALISTSSTIRDTLLNPSLKFYAPNYIFAELFKHKEKLSKYSKLPENYFYVYIEGILNNIRFIHPDFISVEARKTAYDLCKDVDEKDAVFVALTLQLDALFWTGDKKLKAGLRAKGFTSFYEPDQKK